jgi:hypothetical protein
MSGSAIEGARPDRGAGSHAMTTAATVIAKSPDSFIGNGHRSVMRHAPR